MTTVREQGDDAKRLRNLRRKVNRARRFPVNTCPASRHLQLIADGLMRGYPVMQGEEVHCAESMYAVLHSLWTLRTQIQREQGRRGRRGK